MPRGTQHELVGILLDDGPGPVLRMPDGGEWRLEIARRYRHLSGTRVRVTGIRDGFDLIAVKHIEPA